jgi:serine/threonine protein kinase
MQRHSFNALNSTFIVDSEYQFVKELGQGAYGCVVSAKHRRTGEGCAIKKITNINTKVCVCNDHNQGIGQGWDACPYLPHIITIITLLPCPDADADDRLFLFLFFS